MSKQVSFEARVSGAYRARRSKSSIFNLQSSILFLFLLAGAAQAEVKIAGGITNKYRLNGVSYISHTFTNTQAITVSSDVDVTCLSVAGGGGGALHNSDPTGGGGAGGFLTGTVTLVSSASYTVNVGVGGLGNTNTAGEGSGSDGEASYVTNTTTGGAALMRAFGGGGGGDWEDGHGGGSGGGGSDHGSKFKGGAGTNGQGNAGANTAGGKGSGGGAGSAGKNGSGVAGGDGRASTLRDGTAAVTYAAGGACTASTGSGTDAFPNTGNGGGNGVRGGSAYRGGNGGSGIVILRYVDNSTYDPTVTAVTNVARWLVNTGTFRIDRPSADPGCNWIIPFTMSGTAISGTDYGGGPATNNQSIVMLSTNVTIPAGQASAYVNLYPMNTSFGKAATLTLDGSTAGSSSNATVTFAALANASKWAVATVASGGGYATNYTLGSAPNVTNFTALVFTNNGTISVTSGGKIEFLLVGGGGGGGWYKFAPRGGGGGAGGLYTGQVTLAVGAYTIPVVVGGGGQGADGSGGVGAGSPTAGTNTFLGAGELTAYGGGYGSQYGPGGAGGSGGGAGGDIAGAGGLCVSGQGFPGGSGPSGSYGGGGGGAGGTGDVAKTVSDYVANGGPGVVFSWRDGVTPVTYAAGGKGRSGGGAATDGENGGNNTGNGGGAAMGAVGSSHASGRGGSGIVIVRVAENSASKGVVIMLK